ncbi:MAG: FAD-dependent monooxygenase [Xanthomonadales bacterium]|nr:FAD-dependent monooxygenase [Xanthomonadales bacterium]
MHDIHDILVIGAGPAGLSLAGVLARQGLAVCIVDPGTRESLAQPLDDGREIALTPLSRQLLETGAMAAARLRRIRATARGTSLRRRFDRADARVDTAGRGRARLDGQQPRAASRRLRGGDGAGGDRLAARAQGRRGEERGHACSSHTRRWNALPSPARGRGRQPLLQQSPRRRHCRVIAISGAACWSVACASKTAARHRLGVAGVWPDLGPVAAAA